MNDVTRRRRQFSLEGTSSVTISPPPAAELRWSFGQGENMYVVDLTAYLPTGSGTPLTAKANALGQSNHKALRWSRHASAALL